MVVLALIALLAASPAAAQASCSADDTCPYKCARVYRDGASYCDSCCVGAEREPDESHPQVFFDRPLLAAIRRHSVSLYKLPAAAQVTVDGQPADGPIALAGELSMPDIQPSRVLTFSEAIVRPRRPQRNGDRFLICTDPRLPKRTARRNDSRWRFCGVLDLNGEPVYAAPAPGSGGWAEALALSSDGTEAVFEYGRGKAVDSYVFWSEMVGARRYKADPKDLKLRRALHRLGINQDFPE